MTIQEVLMGLTDHTGILTGVGLTIPGDSDRSN